MRQYKVWSIFIFCLHCQNAIAACDLSSWGFSAYRTLEVGGVVIENGSQSAGGTIQMGDSSVITDKYNLSNVWHNSGSGDIHAQQVTQGGTVSFVGVQSYYTVAESSCRISFKPLVDETPQEFSQSGYFQWQFAYGGEFIVEPGCPEGDYTGNVVIEARVVDPVYCPEGGSILSSFTTRIQITTVKGGSVITLRNREDLNFGSFLSPSMPGLIEISPANDTPIYSGIHAIDSNSAHRGQMEVAGISGTQYAIIMPQTEASLYSGSNSLRLTEMSMLHQNAQQPSTEFRNMSLSSSGSDIVYIGGKLEIPANAADGEYVGTYTIQLSY